MSELSESSFLNKAAIGLILFAFAIFGVLNIVMLGHSGPPSTIDPMWAWCGVGLISLTIGMTMAAMLGWMENNSRRMR